VVGQQCTVSCRQPQPNGRQQHADHDPGSSVGRRGAEELVQPEPGEGDRVAEQRRRVLVEDGRDCGVGGRAEVLAERDAAGGRLPPELADRGEPRGAVEQETEAEHGKAHQAHLHFAGVEQALGALPDRQDAADDEDAERGQQ
jgi:hypothetical protein